MKMKMNKDKIGKGRRSRKKIRCFYFIISYNRFIHDKTIFIFKNDQTITINFFNKVYGVPHIKLIHFRHLWLKINREDQNGKWRKTYRTKLRHFIVKGPK